MLDLDREALCDREAVREMLPQALGEALGDCDGDCGTVNDAV